MQFLVTNRRERLCHCTGKRQRRGDPPTQGSGNDQRSERLCSGDCLHGSFIFVFWRPKKGLPNFVCVILPVFALLVGAFLTHSRGGILALLGILLVAARRRIGTVPATLLAGGLLAGALALQFTGGRAISASAGQDRTILWGEGMQMFKAQPLFGSGLRKHDEQCRQYRAQFNRCLRSGTRFFRIILLVSIPVSDDEERAGHCLSGKGTRGSPDRTRGRILPDGES